MTSFDRSAGLYAGYINDPKSVVSVTEAKRSAICHVTSFAEFIIGRAFARPVGSIPCGLKNLVIAVPD